jgi:hypothetical protein
VSGFAALGLSSARLGYRHDAVSLKHSNVLNIHREADDPWLCGLQTLCLEWPLLFIAMPAGKLVGLCVGGFSTKYADKLPRAIRSADFGNGPIHSKGFE